MQMAEDSTNACQACGADWDAGPIPEHIREHYSPPYRWSRRILVMDQQTDRAIAWRCPVCGHTVDVTHA
jgi:rubrerythrin